MAFRALFRKKKSDEEFFDNGQSWQDFLKEHDLGAVVPKFESQGVEKLRDLFLLEDDDVKNGFGLNIVQFRRFKAATEEYKKGQGKARRVTMASTPNKEAPKRPSSKLFTDLPSPSSPDREAAALPTDVAAAASSSSPVQPHMIGGLDSNITSTDDGPAAFVAEPAPGEDVYEDLETAQGSISKEVVEPDFEGSGLYEPPPSESGPARPAPLGDYEDADSVPGSQIGRLPHARPRELTVEPEAAELPSDPKTWGDGEVLRWLKENSFGHFKDVFYANAFTGTQLLALSAGSFGSANFSRTQVDELLQAIAVLRRSRSNAVNSSGGPPLVPRKPSDASPAIPSRPVPLPPPSSAAKDYIMKAKVLYDYEAKNDRQLSIAVDEIVEVMENTRAWWSVRNAAGSVGTVPSNYLEEVADTSDPADNFESYDWFSGDMERGQAEDLLARQAVGTFLVRRNPKDPSDLTLSIKGVTGIIHLKLKAIAGRFSLGAGPTASDCATIPELIAYHRHTEIKVTGKESILLSISGVN